MVVYNGNAVPDHVLASDPRTVRPDIGPQGRSISEYVERTPPVSHTDLDVTVAFGDEQGTTGISFIRVGQTAVERINTVGLYEWDPAKRQLLS